MRDRWRDRKLAVGRRGHGEVEAVTEALVQVARFDDYVPILAHRFAREHLLQLRAVELAEAA